MTTKIAAAITDLYNGLCWAGLLGRVIREELRAKLRR